MNYSNHDCRVRATARPSQPAPRKPQRPVGGSPARSRKSRAALAVGCALLLSTIVPASAQFVIQPNEAQSKDAKVYEFLSGNNFQSNLGVVGAGATPHSFKGLIQFELSAVPIPAGEITLATLELYCSVITPISGQDGSGPGNVSLFLATSEWTETGVTWNTFPSLAPTAADTEFISTAGQWYTFDVTNAVQNWMSGATVNNGFGIVMESPFGQVTLLDAKGLTGAVPDPTLAPRLTVVPEPGTGLLALGGIALCAGRRSRRSASARQ